MLPFVATIISALLFGQPQPAAAANVAPSPTDASPPLAALPEPPPSYGAWLARGDHARSVATFERALAEHDIADVVPTFEILRTAIDWQQCGAEEYALPDAATWPGAFAALAVIKTELVPVVGPVEIVSGYRDEALNACAGGSSGSVHRQFGAFDAFVTGPESRDEMIERLCTWHRERGPALQAGLGIYDGKKFHIDAGLKGFRTWGSDYRRASSPCAA
jgi:hypothetical protein